MHTRSLPHTDAPPCFHRFRYRRDVATFASDSISTVTIVREALAAFGAARKLALRTSYAVHAESAYGVLARVAPLFADQAALARKTALISALGELGLQGASARKGSRSAGGQGSVAPPYLSHECADALRNAEVYARAHARREQATQMLHGIVSDLYVDWCGARERRATRRAELPRLLQNFDLASITHFFRQS